MSDLRPSTEKRLPGLQGFDSWDNTRILATFLDGQRRAIDAVEAALPAISRAADAIAPRLKAGGRLLYAGAGTSIRIAVQDGSELPATFGISESRIDYLIAGGRAAMFETLADAEDDAAQGEADANRLCTPADVLITVAASGRTPYTVAAAKAAKARGCLVVAVLNNAGSPLGAASDIEVLLDSGPEVISGSTRMGAGTAQKAALNFLSTLVFTRLGAVHDGMMVSVEAGNTKLVARAVGMIEKIAEVGKQQAAEALAKTGGNVKLATLLCAGAANIAAAQEILSASDGNLRLALSKLSARV